MAQGISIDWSGPRLDFWHGSSTDFHMDLQSLLQHQEHEKALERVVYHLVSKYQRADHPAAATQHSYLSLAFGLRQEVELESAIEIDDNHSEFELTRSSCLLIASTFISMLQPHFESCQDGYPISDSKHLNWVFHYCWIDQGYYLCSSSDLSGFHHILESWIIPGIHLSSCSQSCPWRLDQAFCQWNPKYLCALLTNVYSASSVRGWPFRLESVEVLFCAHYLQLPRWGWLLIGEKIEMAVFEYYSHKDSVGMGLADFQVCLYYFILLGQKSCDRPCSFQHCSSLWQDSYAVVV